MAKEFNEGRTAKAVVFAMDRWLTESGLSVPEMVELVGKYTSRGGEDRGAWSRWRKNPRKLSVIAYFAIQHAAELNVERNAKS